MNDTRPEHTYARVAELYLLAARADVICSLVGDGNGDWYVGIASAAPSENWVGRDRPHPDGAIEDGIRYLNTIQPKPATGGQPLHVLTPAGRRFHEGRDRWPDAHPNSPGNR